MVAATGHLALAYHVLSADCTDSTEHVSGPLQLRSQRKMPRHWDKSKVALCTLHTIPCHLTESQFTILGSSCRTIEDAERSEYTCLNSEFLFECGSKVELFAGGTGCWWGVVHCLPGPNDRFCAYGSQIATRALLLQQMQGSRHHLQRPGQT